jgi:hypothetical protein
LVSSHFGSHLPHFLHIFLSLFCLLSLCSMSSSPFTLLLLQAFTYEADLSRMSSNFEVKIVNWLFQQPCEAGNWINIFTCHPSPLS